MQEIKIWCNCFYTIFSVTSQNSYVSAQSTKPVTVETDSLNVRSGPGLTYDVIGSLKKGERVRYHFNFRGMAQVTVWRDNRDGLLLG